MTRDAAFQAIASVEAAANHWALAARDESELEDERQLVKHAAIQRLMEAGKATSVTAAEKLVSSDPEYAKHLADLRNAVAQTIIMRGKYDATRLRAELAVKLCALDEQARDLDGETVEVQR